MRWILIFCFVFCFHFTSVAQKENNQWVISWFLYLSTGLSDHTILDFNSISPDTSKINSPARFFLTIASICDSNGELLFYSNGHTVYNRQHDTLWNGAGINPGWLTNYYSPQNGMGVPQGALILPRPGETGQYLHFYVSGEWCPVGSTTEVQPVKLSYSIIDMSLDGGLGGIIPGKKDLIAYHDTLIYGRLTAVKHANGRDWWVVAHKSNTNIYNKLLVTPDTMILYQQQIGRPHVFEQVVQQAVFSPQGDKYVIGITEFLNDTFPNVIDLYDFDRCTGQLSNVRYIEVPSSNLVATGCGFSPNGRWLYVNTNRDIYQYDTWSSNINATRTVVATWDTVANPAYKFYFQLLGPDGKIYITNYQSAAYLHVIDNPDAQGTACNVIQGGLQLPVLNTFVLPNAVNYSLGPVAGSVCDTLTAISEHSQNLVISNLSPNPNHGEFTVNYFLPNGKKGTLEIFNATGKMVYQMALPNHTYMQDISIRTLPAGIYLLRIRSHDKSLIRKFIKL